MPVAIEDVQHSRREAGLGRQPQAHLALPVLCDAEGMAAAERDILVATDPQVMGDVGAALAWLAASPHVSQVKSSTRAPPTI